MKKYRVLIHNSTQKIDIIADDFECEKGDLIFSLDNEIIAIFNLWTAFYILGKDED